MACRTVTAPSELQRVGVTPTGQWYLGSGVGRGVWCCRRESCVRDLSRPRLAKALRREVSESDLAQIRNLVGGAEMDSVVRN